MRFYVSHSIRGKYGKDATPIQMKENCDAIKAVVNEIKASVPIADFYVPAEHEDFVSRAYNSDYMTEKQILDIDCQIILDTCNAVIIYVPEGDALQGGRRVEYDFAMDFHIPVFIFSTAQEAIELVADFIIRS